MIVISDTTPIVSLIKISRIDLLEKLFGEDITNIFYELGYAHALNKPTILLAHENK